MSSSMEIWGEARRRARNHLRVALVESGVKAAKVAKMNLEKQVDDLLSKDGCEYLKVSFWKITKHYMIEDEMEDEK